MYQAKHPPLSEITLTIPTAADRYSRLKLGALRKSIVPAVMI